MSGREGIPLALQRSEVAEYRKTGIRDRCVLKKSDRFESHPTVTAGEP